MRNILPLAIVAALGAVVIACNNTGAGSPKIQLATYQYDTIVYDTQADSADIPGSQYWKMTGNGVLPVSIGGIEMTNLRDSLMALGNVQFNAGLAVPVIDSTMKFTRTRIEPDSLGGSYVSNDLSVYLITPRVIVWENKNENYIAGAAHGMYSTTYLNYSIGDHKIITLSDLFKKGYEKKLKKMLKEKLADNEEVTKDNDLPIPSTFCITTDGLSFVYGLYEISSYSAGEIRVDFSAYELTDLLSLTGSALLGVN